MKISDLQPNSSFDMLKVRILSRQGPKRIGARGKGLKFVWSFLIVDDTGTTVLSLWGPSAGEGYKIGEVLGISNGWCKVYAGQKQISLGREGKMKKLPDDVSLPRQIDP